MLVRVFAERRLLQKMTLGSTMSGYARDVNETYIQQGGVGGKLMAGASVLFEGTDQLFAGAVGQEYHAPHGLAGRTRRDLGALLGDVVHLRPLKALGDAWRLGTSDWILDGGDAVFGLRQGARHSMEHTLAA